MGWDENSINAVEMAKRAENAGASAITVHGRTRKQMYAPPVDRSIISEVKKSISIPVIGNGDIIDEQSAAIMLEETNCDLIMIGRGALGCPWVFSQINAYLEHGRVLPTPPVAERMRVMIKHIETLCQYKGDYVGMREARKHAGWYTKGFQWCLFPDDISPHHASLLCTNQRVFVLHAYLHSPLYIDKAFQYV